MSRLRKILQPILVSLVTLMCNVYPISGQNIEPHKMASMEMTHNTVSDTNAVSHKSIGIFSTDNFIPREVCMGRDQTTLIVYIIGSFSVFLAYFFIPIMLLRFRSKLKSVFPKIIGVPFLLASLFIFSCGAGHLIDIILVKYPVYKFMAIWTCFTGLCSWAFFLYVFKYLKVFDNTSNKSSTDDEKKGTD